MSRRSNRDATQAARDNRAAEIARKQHRGTAGPRGYSASVIPACSNVIFQRGRPLVAVSTGDVGGAAIFEDWTLRISNEMRRDTSCNAACFDRVIDWHYSGGLAQVLVHPGANFDAVRAYVQSAIHHDGLPKDPSGKRMNVLAWLSGDGLYRAGVTEVPEGTIAVL